MNKNYYETFSPLNFGEFSRLNDEINAYLINSGEDNLSYLDVQESSDNHHTYLDITLISEEVFIRLNDEFNNFLENEERNHSFSQKTIIPTLNNSRVNLEYLLNSASYFADIPRNNSVGKLVLTYDKKLNRFYLFTKGISDGIYFTINKDPKIFRDFTDSDMFHNLFGAHKIIHDHTQDFPILGGGAYFTEGKKIHIDYKSEDFGEMNLEIVRRCIIKAGYTLSILDEKYFNNFTPLKYLGCFFD